MISFQAHASGSFRSPGARREYSSQGGSTSTTSNFVPKVSGVRGRVRKSACQGGKGEAAAVSSQWEQNCPTVYILIKP